MCQLLVDTLDANMNLIVAVSEESADNCEEILEALQLLLVHMTVCVYSTRMHLYVHCECVDVHICMCLLDCIKCVFIWLLRLKRTIHTIVNLSTL